MKQYSLQQNELILTVKRAPIAIRLVLFLFSAVFFLLPIMWFMINVSAKNGLHMGLFIFMIIFGLCGFRLLRISLWNTYGREIIHFNENEFTYVADYKWFKDGRKMFSGENLRYSFIGAGYEEDGKGVLVLEIDDTKKQCATKMNLEELDELVKQLERRAQ